MPIGLPDSAERPASVFRQFSVRRGVRIVVLLAAFAAAVAVGCVKYSSSRPKPPEPKPQRPGYPLHQNITATVFWVGEPPSAGSPTNVASAWDERWQQHFGGFDDPNHRNGFAPAGFAPKENPFYCALPYNDIPRGRDVALRIIPWANDPAWRWRKSLCKNRWVRVARGGRVCCAQWEDVGPFRTDDAAYVFGTAAPANTSNSAAGIDVSPAVRDFLAIPGGMAKVDWQFVDDKDVPPGPWKTTVTTTDVAWK